MGEILLREYLAKDWWMIAIRGVMTLFFGIAAFVWPGITLTMLVLLYGAYMLGDGVFAVMAGVMSRGWGMVLVGLLGIAAGIVTFMWPGMTVLVLLWIIALTAIVRGAFEITTAIEWRKVIEHEWLLMLGGIISVLFGVVLLSYPVAGALAAIYLIAGYAVVFGVVLLALAMRLRRLPRAAQAAQTGL